MSILDISKLVFLRPVWEYFCFHKYFNCCLKLHKMPNYFIRQLRHHQLLPGDWISSDIMRLNFSSCYSQRCLLTYFTGLQWGPDWQVSHCCSFSRAKLSATQSCEVCSNWQQQHCWGSTPRLHTGLRQYLPSISSAGLNSSYKLSTQLAAIPDCFFTVDHSLVL